MVTKTAVVINEQGLHMRPAGALAKKVKEYADCEVLLKANDKTVKANSPMQIMSACMKKGCEVEIVCDGLNEDKALEEVLQMFNDGFGEM